MINLAPYSKAIYAAVLGFIAPGATLLIADAATGSISGTDWLVAGLTCVVASAAGGVGVYAAPKNKSKAAHPYGHGVGNG